MMEVLTRVGAHLHTREGKRWWPTQSIPWIGSMVNARGGVDIEPEKRQEGLDLRDVAMALPAESALPDRTVCSTASYRNCL